MSVPLRQFALQAGASFFVLSLAWPYFGMRAEAMPWAETAFVIGFFAFSLACLTRQPVWWRFLHALFMPLVWAVSQFNIDPGWFLLAFLLMLMVYRGAVSGRIPLYLSNAASVGALDDLLAAHGVQRFADLGAGIATTLLPLARRHPGIHFYGVENAPLTWVIGRWRTRAQGNLDWRWGDLWATRLQEFDLVYVFLSPAPMTDLWRKAQTEMAAGSLFVSNTFAVPDVKPDRVVDIEGENVGPLYCYQVRK